MVLSGPRILQSDEAPANIITATLRNKIGLAVDSAAISEATTITLKKRNPTDPVRKISNSKFLTKVSWNHKFTGWKTSKCVRERGNLYSETQSSTQGIPCKAAVPDKIHSTYMKNGILRINPKGNSTDPAQPVKIRNEVELREFVKTINFVSQSTGTDDTNQTPENESRWVF